MIKQYELREALDYDQGTGVFTWRKSSENKISRGDVAGCIDDKGYIRIRVNGKLYRAHRLAWIYIYGSSPSSQIDHIDQDKSNNRIANLREATNSQNAHNRGLLSTNKSGVTGVHYDKNNKYWVARIGIEGKQTFLYCGDFDSAVAIRRDAEAKHHPRRPA